MLPTPESGLKLPVRMFSFLIAVVLNVPMSDTVAMFDNCILHLNVLAPMLHFIMEVC